MVLSSVVKSGYPHGDAFIFEFSSETEARGMFACDTKTVITTLEKWGSHRAVVRIPGQPDLDVPIATLRLMQQFEPLVQVFFADVSLPPSVLKAIAAKSEDSGRWGIVRLQDERQVVMSSGMSGVLLAGVGIDETTQWKRPEFWKLDDLDEFNRDWKQRLNSDGSNSIECRYRIRKPGTQEPWEWYRSSYRLLQGENNLLYQVCTFVDRG